MIAAFIDGLFRYQFLQNALLTSVIVGLISGVIGSFIILRGMSLIPMLFYQGSLFLICLVSIIFLALLFLAY